MLAKFIYLSLIGIFFGCFDTSIAQAPSDKANRSESVNKYGRIVGVVDTIFSGSGMGPRYQQFVMQENSHSTKGEKQKLYRIVYEYFYKRDKLKNNFFDFSIEYKFKLIRDNKCDEKPEVFAAETINDQSVTVLQILTGADNIDFEVAEKMECYILHPQQYEKN